MGKLIRRGQMPEEQQAKLAEQGWTVTTGPLFKKKSNEPSETKHQPNPSNDKNGQEAEATEQNSEDVH